MIRVLDRCAIKNVHLKKSIPNAFYHNAYATARIKNWLPWIFLQAGEENHENEPAQEQPRLIRHS